MPNDNQVFLQVINVKHLKIRRRRKRKIGKKKWTKNVFKKAYKSFKF